MPNATTRLIRGSNAAARTTRRPLARLLLEILVAPIHERLLLTGEPVDDGLAERLVELALNGAAATRAQL